MKFLLALACAVLFVACKNEGPPKLTDKTKGEVTEKIKAELKDPASYTPLEWSEIDTLYKTVDPNNEYAGMQAKLDSLDKETTIDFDNPKKVDYHKNDSLNRLASDIRDKMIRFAGSMPQVVDGWRLQHKFKTTDENRLPEIKTYSISFDFDMNIKYIEDVTDIFNR